MCVCVCGFLLYPDLLKLVDVDKIFIRKKTTWPYTRAINSKISFNYHCSLSKKGKWFNMLIDIQSAPFTCILSFSKLRDYIFSQLNINKNTTGVFKLKKQSFFHIDINWIEVNHWTEMFFQFNQWVNISGFVLWFVF